MIGGGGGGSPHFPILHGILPPAVSLRRTRVANKKTNGGGNPILTGGPGLAFAVDYPIGDGVEGALVIRVGKMVQFRKGFFSEL